MQHDGHIGRIAFVGAGRVAATLAWAMHGAGLPVAAVFGRTRGRAAEIVSRVPGAVVADSAQAAADAADLVFVAVSDDAIAGACEQLSWRADHGVVHCSGVTELDALRAAAAAGARVGAFHPMQMFANPDVALATLPGCTITIEAGEPLAQTLECICQRIRCRPMRLPPGSRALYHASIYNVGPFLIALMQEAARIWRSFGATEQETLAALLPLLRGTLAAVADAGLAGGMGGCVARGDVGTVERHLAALEAFAPEMAALYRQLALRTIPLALTRGTLSPELAGRIRRTLEAQRLRSIDGQ
jgi:predicted short-subunit dehydrogenase-like oxidoreductase (DUF2520 family)